MSGSRCPVCGQACEEYAPYCTRCGWELSSPLMVGEVSDEEAQVYTERLQIARRNWEHLARQAVQNERREEALASVRRESQISTDISKGSHQLLGKQEHRQSQAGGSERLFSLRGIWNSLNLLNILFLLIVMLIGSLTEFSEQMRLLEIPVFFSMHLVGLWFSFLNPEKDLQNLHQAFATRASGKEKYWLFWSTEKEWNILRTFFFSAWSLWGALSIGFIAFSFGSSAFLYLISGLSFLNLSIRAYLSWRNLPHYL